MDPLNFAANLSWLYTELPLLDRFEAAARDGFKGVELLFPHEHPTSEIRARLDTWGLQLVLFNAEPGQWAQGERGLAGLPGRESDFKRSIETALTRAQALDCPLVHVMAGLCPGRDATARTAALHCYATHLAWAADLAQAAGKTLVIEPINPRDMPDYLLTHQAQAHELVQRIGSDHVGVQMDLYHCQIVEGDVTHRLREALPTGRVRHLQIAAVPDRGEPDAGELHYPHVLDELQRLGYRAWIGCEYRPRRAGPGGTTAGLRWMDRWR